MSAVSIIRGVGRTDVGRRSHNEDAFLVEESLGLMLVADGVGGHRVGEIASGITCQSVCREITAGRPLAAALRQANRDVRTAVEGDHSHEGMASTAVALHFHGADYDIAWVGDSRAYLWDGQLRLLTQDHSYVQTLLNDNKITLAQARHHPHKAVIVQAIGLQDEGNLQVGENSGTLGAGQVLLLCSDGLNDAVDSSKIAELLSQERDLATVCESLVAEALASGGRDNITVVLAAGAAADLKPAVPPRHIYWSFDPATGDHISVCDVHAPLIDSASADAVSAEDATHGTQIFTAAEIDQIRLATASNKKSSTRKTMAWVIFSVILVLFFASLLSMSLR